MWNHLRFSFELKKLFFGSGDFLIIVLLHLYWNFFFLHFMQQMRGQKKQNILWVLKNLPNQLRRVVFGSQILRAFFGDYCCWCEQSSAVAPNIKFNNLQFHFASSCQRRRRRGSNAWQHKIISLSEIMAHKLHFIACSVTYYLRPQHARHREKSHWWDTMPYP